MIELEPLRLTEEDVQLGRALVVCVHGGNQAIRVGSFTEPGTTAHLAGDGVLVVRSPNGHTLALVSGNYSVKVTVG